jgi:hypothetical protein
MNETLKTMKQTIFGDHHISSIAGYLTTLALVIYLNPTSVDFLPPDVQKYIKGFAGLIALASGLTLSRVLVDGASKSNQQQGEEEVKKDNVSSAVKIGIITLLGGAIFMMTACSTIAPNTSDLPSTATSAEKAAAIQKDIVLHLSDSGFQAGVKNALVIAGRQALQRATSDSDRTEIANQMWAASSAFNSLASGNAVTAEQVDATAKSFAAGLDVKKYGDFLNAANLAWSLVYPKLKQADSSDLWRTWLIILADAAGQVAQSYKTN